MGGRLQQSRSVFKAAYMAFLLINIIPMVNHFPYTDILLLVFAVWGMGLLIADLIRYRLHSYQGRGVILLSAFFVLCGVSVLFHPHNALMNSVMRLGIFFLCGAVLYITAHRDLRREAVTVATVYVGVSALMAAVSVGMYVLQFRYRFIGPLGEKIRIGVWENRLFGVFSSGNVGGSVMAIGLLLAVGLLGYYYKQGKLTVGKAALLAVAALTQVWHIALTLSRGTTVSLAVATVVLCAVLPLGKSGVREVGRRLLCLATAVAVFTALTAGFRWVSLTAVELLEEGGLIESEVTGFDRIEYDEEDAEEKDISNKRFGIWKANLHLLKGQWLLGTGRNYYEYLRVKDTADWLTEEDHTYLEWSKGNTHNGYLQILMDGGVLALAVYLAFLVWCLIKVIRAYVRGSRWDRRLLAVCLAVTVYVLVNNLFETNMVLMSTNPIQAIFWFVAGVTVTSCHRILEREGER